MSGFSNGGSVTASSVQAYAQPIYNVKTYGAVGNNVADDTTAIQAAINACQNAGGGTVYLPPGTYKTTASLIIGNGKGIEAPLAASMNGTTPTGTYTLTVNTANQRTYNGAAFATGGGYLVAWTASLTTVLMQYTSYNAGTGVFSGVTTVLGSWIPIVADGTYAASMVVTQGSVSTAGAVRLCGAAPPGSDYLGTIGYKAPTTTINFTGTLAAAIVQWGPLNGWGIYDLYLNCSGGNVVGGISQFNASFGEMRNVSVEMGTGRDKLQALSVSGYAGFYNTLNSTIVVGASYGNNYYNIDLQGAGTGNGVFAGIGVLDFTGDTGGFGYPSANATFCNIQGLTVSIGPTGTGTDVVRGIRFGFCDDVSICQTNFIANATAFTGVAGTGLGQCMTWDYTQYPGGNAPFNCLVDDVTYPQPSGVNFTLMGNLGSPSSLRPNKIANPRVEASVVNNTPQGIAGTVWGPGGYLTAPSVTSGSAFQPNPVQNSLVTLYLKGVAAGNTVTVTIGNTTAGTGTTIVSALVIDTEATEISWVVPAAWYTVITTAATISSARAVSLAC